MTRVEPVYAEIGRRIARAREHRGLSQEMLGASLSPPLTRAAISNMEGGRQRIMLHVLIDVADALGATTREFISPHAERRPARGRILLSETGEPKRLRGQTP